MQAGGSAQSPRIKNSCGVCLMAPGRSAKLAGVCSTAAGDSTRLVLPPKRMIGACSRSNQVSLPNSIALPADTRRSATLPCPKRKTPSACAQSSIVLCSPRSMSPVAYKAGNADSAAARRLPCTYTGCPLRTGRALSMSPREISRFCAWRQSTSAAVSTPGSSTKSNSSKPVASPSPIRADTSACRRLAKWSMSLV